MSVKSCEKLDKSKVALTIEADAAAFEAAINKAYLKQRGKISVPGFRPGKAPRKMIESMYGAEVFYEEAVNILLPDAYEDAVKEQELKVVGYPEVELESCGKDGVVFKCTVAVYPEVTLGQYKGLEAPKAEVNVTDEDVENRLNEMADRNSRLVSVEREIQKGDTADIDFEGFDNGVPFDGGKGENFDLEIGSGSFVPCFEDQLVGMKAGEEKDIDITFPENYTPELAGKPVVFHVKVNEVKHKEVPAIDDEFAKDVSEFDTLEELKADTRKQLTNDREAAAQRAFEDALMQKVADGIQADIPDEMVDVQAQQMMENFQQQLAAQGIGCLIKRYLMSTLTEFQSRAHSGGTAADHCGIFLFVRGLDQLVHSVHDSQIRVNGAGTDEIFISASRLVALITQQTWNNVFAPIFIELLAVFGIADECPSHCNHIKLFLRKIFFKLFRVLISADRRDQNGGAGHFESPGILKRVMETRC